MPDDPGLQNQIKILYNIPKPRQEWKDGKFIQRHEKNEEAWVELFIDLVYVVLLAKLGNMLCYCPLSILAFSKLLVIFGGMCLTRQCIDEYSNRFYSHDLLHKGLYLFYTCGVFVQVLNINYRYDVEQNTCIYLESFAIGFNVGFLMTRLAMILIYLMVLYHNQDAQSQFNFDIKRWLVSVSLVGINVGLDAAGYGSDLQDVLFMGVVVLVETVGWIFVRSVYRARFRYPVDLDLMQSRWGVWVMIVLGEAIIQLLYPNLTEQHLEQAYVLTILALALMFSVAMQYFDGCQREWYEHAYTQSALAGAAWIWLHVPLTFALFCAGANLKLMLKNGLHSSAATIVDRKLLSYGMGVANLSITLIRHTHDAAQECTRRQAVVYRIRYAIAALQISVAHWGVASPIGVILAQLLLSAGALNVVDTVFDFLEAKDQPGQPVDSPARQPRPWSGLRLHVTPTAAATTSEGLKREKGSSSTDNLLALYNRWSPEALRTSGKATGPLAVNTMGTPDRVNSRFSSCKTVNDSLDDEAARDGHMGRESKVDDVEDTSLSIESGEGNGRNRQQRRRDPHKLFDEEYGIWRPIMIGNGSFCGSGSIRDMTGTMITSTSALVHLDNTDDYSSYSSSVIIDGKSSGAMTGGASEDGEVSWNQRVGSGRRGRGWGRTTTVRPFSGGQGGTTAVNSPSMSQDVDGGVDADLESESALFARRPKARSGGVDKSWAVSGKTLKIYTGNDCGIQDLEELDL